MGRGEGGVCPGLDGLGGVRGLEVSPACLMTRADDEVLRGVAGEEGIIRVDAGKY